MSEKPRLPAAAALMLSLFAQAMQKWKWHGLAAAVGAFAEAKKAEKSGDAG